MDIIWTIVQWAEHLVAIWGIYAFFGIKSGGGGGHYG